MKTKTKVSIIIALAAVALACVFFQSVPVEAIYPVLRLRVVARRILRTEENARLRREVSALTQALQDAERLEAENARLRRALEYAERTEGRWVAAEVLSRGGAAAGNAHVIRIGKGVCDDFAVGAVVVVPEGLVGRVTSITPHTAEVTLVTDPSVQVSCLIEGGGSREKGLGMARGVLSGGTRERLVLKHLRNGDDLPPRARVVTSGLGGVFPKGIEVGVVEKVERVGGGGETSVIPSVDFEALEDVFVRVTGR